MGLWIPIILMCSAPYATSCIVITGNELVNTKEQCFEESMAKAKVAMESPTVFQAKPMCQVIPSKVLPEKGKNI
jgi:hypothetical protein|tara:strand:- start:428 stop:649 length:222 start_codon:yes stop_codon:yes gene_type:complete